MIIMTTFDGLFRPITAPRHAAAYAIEVDAKQGTAAVIFALKLERDKSALTTITRLRKTMANLTWKPVSSSPQSINKGGISDKEAPFRVLDFKRAPDGAWLLEGPDMDRVADQLSRASSDSIDLPKGTHRTIADVQKLLATPEDK